MASKGKRVCMFHGSIEIEANRGKDHWMRVLYDGPMLAKETGANLNVVELFAIIHHCQRDNDD